MSITKPYFVHLITEQSESPSLNTGYRITEPVSKTPQVSSAGWGNVKGYPENKTIYSSLKPTAYEMITSQDRRLKPHIDPESTDRPAWGPHIRERVREMRPARYTSRAYEALPESALPSDLGHWFKS